jgi:hypothetical protein
MSKRRGPPKGKAVAIDPANPPELTVDEVADLYPGQWVLMRVTEDNEYHQAWRGHILAVSDDECDLNEVLAREPKRSQLPPGVKPGRYYVFQAYHYIYPGPEWDAWLAWARRHNKTDGPVAQG